MKWNKGLKRIMFIFVWTLLVLVTKETQANAAVKETEVATPENFVVKRYANKALRLKWKKVEEADGYRIYRYNKKQQKYIRIKTIENNNKTSWIHKGLHIHKVYKYKIAAYKNVKGKKIFSKRSYWVKARTYGERGKIVNVCSVDAFFIGPNSDNPVMNIYSTGNLQGLLDADDTVKRNNARVLSKKIRWSSSDNNIISVNKDGEITSHGKEGVCTIYLRAHNGITEKIKVKVVDYANPDSFPYYNGGSKYITELLVNYKKELCSLATYFTKYSEEMEKGVIEVNEDGVLEGLEKLKNSWEIKEDVERLLNEFPLLGRIYYGNGYVRVRMRFDAMENSYVEIEYSMKDDFMSSPLCIAPHWVGRHFAPM